MPLTLPLVKTQLMVMALLLLHHPRQVSCDTATAALCGLHALDFAVDYFAIL